MGETRHTRQIPEEWPKLVTYAESIVPPSAGAEKQFGRAALWRLIRRLYHLSDESIEANYYYGLGEVMTGMASRLQDERTRHGVVQEAAQRMVRWAIFRRGKFMPLDKPFTPLVADLRGPQLDPPLHQLAVAELDSMSRPHRALMEAISTTIGFRHHHPNTSRLSLPFQQFVFASAARATLPTASFISRNSLTGALGVWRKLLLSQDPNQAFHEHDLVAIQPAAMEEVRRSRAFIGAASLRIDELAAGVGWRKSGTVQHFDASVLAEPPIPREELDGPRPLREARQACPAIQASGLAGDVARNLVPEIIIAARGMIPAEVPPIEVNGTTI